MKILFYQYGNEDWISIGHLSAILKKAGCQTDLLLEPPLDLYLKLPFINKERILKNLLRRAEKFEPDLLAVSSTTDAFPHARQIIKLVKKRFKIPVIIGGIQATSLPEYTLANTEADIACVGEGDYALLELVQAMQSNLSPDNINNLWIKKRGGGIIKNPVRPLIEDLDSLPFPDKEIFRQYGCLTRDYNIMAGRGCPYQCTYCCNHIYQRIYKGKGRYVRRRSVENVIKELTENSEKYKFKSVYFWDDTFILDKNWLKRFAKRYKNDINLPFHCLSRPENINEEAIVLLKDAGCSHINIGLESGSEKIRKNVLNRHYTNEQFTKAVHLIRQHKIKLNLFNMLGIPGESSDDMWNTVKMNKAANPDGCWAHLFKPFPETDIARSMLENGMLSNDDMETIKAGKGGKIISPETDVLKNHPHKDLARRLMVYLPLEHRIPSFLKKIIEKKVTQNIFSNKLIKIISLLSVDTSRSFYKLQALLNTLHKVLF